jgi:hypothetical protein
MMQLGSGWFLHNPTAPAELHVGRLRDAINTPLPVDKRA